ncbi:adenosylcobinamide-GDP ribazoletransferase [Parendozoicomonas sp. Alg238-R29]|uniref:adenosylcobinamide-GDP ribazoletransferase n=1 Tax=Parendozoicomonas sp. Alg238-R29 TaxID=2993446 RepID=UPI00248DBF65|nr:adenosylcobinamide-GDP ribazoletransferase [Parendozoicomonas sp. Alg238-R29]
MAAETIPTIERHARALALSVGFFTRLPTKHLETIEDQDMGRALVYLPLVGLIIGLLAAGGSLLLSAVLSGWHGSLTAVHLSLIGVTAFTLVTLVSGGLHLDGLGDCADAWVGGLGDKERTLTIMKDPVCGPMAVMVVVLVLVIKASAVVGLAISENWLPLLLIPVLSRSAGMALFLTTNYVRPKGLGQTFSNFCSDAVTRYECCVALTAGVVIPAFLLASAWPALGLAALVWHGLRQQTVKRLDGFTGDVCGAVIEIIEALLFLTVALFI